MLNDGNMPLRKATRIEVIDSSGRVFVAYRVSGVVLSIQDDGKTLKVFCERKEAPRDEQ